MIVLDFYFISEGIAPSGPDPRAKLAFRAISLILICYSLGKPKHKKHMVCAKKLTYNLHFFEIIILNLPEVHLYFWHI